MNKIIIGVIALACITGTVYAESKTAQSTQRDFGNFTVDINIYENTLSVSRFIDPDNGNICYLAVGYRKGGISCVKP